MGGGAPAESQQFDQTVAQFVLAAAQAAEDAAAEDAALAEEAGKAIEEASTKAAKAVEAAARSAVLGCIPTKGHSELTAAHRGPDSAGTDSAGRTDSDPTDLKWIEEEEAGSADQLADEVLGSSSGGLHLQSHQSELEHLHRVVFDLQLQNSLMAHELASGATRELEAQQLRHELGVLRAHWQCWMQK